MHIKKRKKTQGQGLPLVDIEKINTVYLDELERVKTRLSYIRDPELINAFFNVLLNSYNSTIDLKTFEREVDYDIKLSEIEARRAERKPWRRCWWWRLLLFFPLTNRAQDIIEARAELEADVEHTAEEKAIEDERKQLSESEEKPSKRKLKRIMRDKLKAAIRQADNADVREAFDEPAEPKATAPTLPQKTGNQLPGQVTIDDVQPVQNVPARRPRPPRSCRR